MEFSDHEEEDDMEIEEAPTNYNDDKPLLLQNHPLLNPRLNKNQPPVHSNRPLPPFNPNYYYYFYKECLKNHALAVGGHALDGCGEFMPAGPDGSLDALRCAACSCHRNFHRKDVISYLWPRAPTTAGCLQVVAPLRQKRVRTKFTEEQKEKMLVMAEKLEWRIQKSDEAAVMEFCNEIGVKRRVLKVWMHNNKNTFRKESEQNKLSLDHNIVI